MTRQVLDVGDLVQCGDEQGVIAHIAGERHVLALPGRGQLGGLHRTDLTRVGGDLQLCDAVTVSGECADLVGHVCVLTGARGVIVDDFEDGTLLVHLLGEVMAVQARPDQLTRISRAEVLA